MYFEIVTSPFYSPGIASKHIMDMLMMRTFFYILQMTYENVR